MVHNIIKFALDFYRKKQLINLTKKWQQNAIIGDMFEASLTSSIFNESVKKDNIIIGHHSKMKGRLVCKESGKIVIGNYSCLESDSAIACMESVKIGHFVGIAGGTVISDNNNHMIDREEWVKHRIRLSPGGEGYPGLLGSGWELSDHAPVIINDAVWIGAMCSILKGVNVGEGSIVARASVVTKDVPPYTIVAGNPAKVVKEINKPNRKYYDINIGYINP